MSFFNFHGDSCAALDQKFFLRGRQTVVVMGIMVLFTIFAWSRDNTNTISHLNRFVQPRRVDAGVEYGQQDSFVKDDGKDFKLIKIADLERIKQTKKDLRQKDRSATPKRRDVNTTDLPLKCDPVKLRFDSSLPVTALYSYPGSGNTWVRHLLQQATGNNIQYQR